MSIADLERGLSTLSPGDRAWFWFCAEATLPLLVEPFSEEEGVKKVLRTASSLLVATGAVECSGIASMAPDGRLRFGSPLLTQAGLTALAEWVHEHQHRFPELLRLKCAQFIHLRADGEIQEIYTEPLWDALPEPLIPGTLRYTAHLLERMSPGEDYWFWMQRSVETVPRFVLLKVADDPNGDRFIRWAVGWHRALGVGQHAVRGVARLNRHGAVVLTTADPLDEGQQTLAFVARRAEIPMQRLAQARLVAIDAGQFSEIRAQKLPQVPDPVQGLRALDAGEKLWFWFTNEDCDGEPSLILNVERDAVKAAARALVGPGQRTRGVVRKSSKGWVEFRAMSDFSGFLPALAEWTRSRLDSGSALSVLCGARMSVRDGDTIVNRYRNDALWAAVFDEQRAQYGGVG